MLYQTHHPLLFQFPPFTSFTTPHLSTTSSSSVFLSSSCLSLSQAETEMECVQEAALKSSFRKDTAMKLTPQTFLEELSAFNVQNIAPSDDFFVDELLDFSHEEEEESLLEEQPQQQQQNHSPQHNTQNQTHEIHDPSFNNCHFGSLPTNELSVPAEDAADLEWLSYFVEDSFSEFSIPFPTGTITEAKAPEPKSPFSTPCFKTPVPAKARSKRTRTGVRVWPLKSPSFAESSSTSSSTTHSSSSSTSSSVLIFTASVEQCSQLPEKKVKRKASPEGEGRGGGAGQVLPRRCSHCGVQKTPQWRTGPLGAKTLCNACGVRYKSGRLLPEYRPACSPTFSSELHSNHHRKVLEMRQKKEVEGEPVPAPGSAPPPVFSGF